LRPFGNGIGSAKDADQLNAELRGSDCRAEIGVWAWRLDEERNPEF